jgi:ribonuclease HI
MKARAVIDGGSRGNPGEAGCGIVLELPGGVRQEHHVYLGVRTNNVAEYAALLVACEQARRLGVEEFEVRSDSELLVRQMCGDYRVRARHLMPLFERARRLAWSFARFTIEHVPRTSTREADRLANLAMDNHGATLPVPQGLP